jgi:hypothetical protein
MIREDQYQSYKLFSSLERIFAAKLDHFITNDFFLHVTNTQALQQNWKKGL